jgi:hypothetical protein
MVAFTEPGSTLPDMVQVRFSITGVSRMRTGGGVTAMVADSTGEIVVAGWLVTLGTILIVAWGVVLSGVPAQTTTCSTRRRRHKPVVISRNPNVVSRCMENPV